jgi:hypothetical protein
VPSLLACYHLAQNRLSSRLPSKNINIRICNIIILPLLLYGRETLSLTVREEHKLKVFENRALRRIFGPKRDGVARGWRKLHNEELHNLYTSSSIIRYIRFEVFTTITMKNAVFGDVKPCGSCNNQRFVGTYRLHHQGDKNRRGKENVSSK